tara:strand:- start:725 stop:1441 length:717 start_codon:yes stop_codon:yes gene_type:complete
MLKKPFQSHPFLSSPILSIPLSAHYLKDMIAPTGKNLNVLICTEPGLDWQTFATWYSCYRNIPDARVTIACQRNGKAPFQLFQWAKRVNVPVLHHNPFSDDPIMNKLNAVRTSGIKENLLALEPLVIVAETFDPKIITDTFDKRVWFLEKPNTEEMMNAYVLDGMKLPDSEPICVEAKESDEPSCLVSYKKGCGKWIDTLKGCPFSNAAGLALTTMTINENRVIELWKKMCPLYSVLA